MCIASATEIRFTESHETRGNQKAPTTAQRKPYWSAVSQKAIRRRQDKPAVSLRAAKELQAMRGEQPKLVAAAGSEAAT